MSSRSSCRLTAKTRYPVLLEERNGREEATGALPQLKAAVVVVFAVQSVLEFFPDYVEVEIAPDDFQGVGIGLSCAKATSETSPSSTPISA